MKSEERIVKNTKKKKPRARLFFLEAPPGISARPRRPEDCEPDSAGMRELRVCEIAAERGRFVDDLKKQKAPPRVSFVFWLLWS